MPLQLLAGAIIYDSHDISKAISDFNAAYREISKEGIPKQLTLQQMVFNAPPGRLFGVGFTWSSEEIEEGQHWCERIASLGNVMMNKVSETTIPEWCTGNAGVIPSTMYGSFRTLNLHNLTEEVISSIGRELQKMPSDPGTMFSIHQSRISSSTPHSDSVFVAREPHFMLEIIGCASTEENKEKSEQWAFDLWEDINTTDLGNFLDNTYISLDRMEEQPQLATLKRFFGSHLQDIIATKKRYDPENVFDLTVPRLSSFL